MYTSGKLVHVTLLQSALRTALDLWVLSIRGYLFSI